MKKITLLLIVLSSLQIQAQTVGQDKLGNWLMYFGNTKLSQHYSLHTEAQLRLYEAAGNFNQLLLRVGLNRHLGSQAMVTLGYGYIPTETLREGDTKASTIEHRIWQQLILTNRLSRHYFEHRYRVEQRWVASDTEQNYLNRLRYRLLWNIPLNNKEMADKTLFISLYDEIFLNVQDNPFDQNRLYAALGYKFNKALSVQTGYLRHRLGPNNYNRLQLALFINTDLSGTASQ